MLVIRHVNHSANGLASTDFFVVFWNNVVLIYIVLQLFLGNCIILFYTIIIFISNVIDKIGKMN